MEQIILIGHGSPKKEANNINVIADLLHRTIHPGCGKTCVKVAYLQFVEPDIRQAIEECAADGAQTIILHPFFLSAGMHVTKDIPEVIAEAKAAHPGIDFRYTEPLGLHDGLVDIVLDRIRSVTFEKPLDIEKRSFEIIGDEIDLSGLPREQVPIVTRVIHATADFEFRDSLVFHPDAVPAALQAIRSGKDILTDIEMVRSGINRKLLERWGGKVVCLLNDEDVVKTSEETGRTRAEISMEKGLGQNVGIVVIGNAPTALLRMIELLNGAALGAQRPLPVVVGVPVGFVKALESKSLLSTQPFPFITNLSRKGGTPVAVAVVNALLKMAADDEL